LERGASSRQPARQLGPIRVGALSSAVALVALVQPAAELGLEMLVRRDVARSPADSADRTRTALGLLFVALMAGMVPADEVNLIRIIAIGLLHPVLSVAEPWRQARGRGRGRRHREVVQPRNEAAGKPAPGATRLRHGA
jgi:O-antigen/teichoic acid export membrane protein